MAVKLVDMRTRDYMAMGYPNREDAIYEDFYALLEYLIELAGITHDDLNEDAWECFDCGYPEDAFGYIIGEVFDRDVPVPSWWFEQLACIPRFRPPYSPEEMQDVADCITNRVDEPDPWVTPEEAA